MTTGNVAWPGVRMRYLFDEIDDRVGAATSEATLLSVSIHRGVIPRSEITDREARADDFVAYKRVRKGDIVINRMRAFEGGAGVSDYTGIVSSDYAVLRTGAALDSRFFHHLVRSRWFVGEMTARLRGIGGIEAGNVRTPRINVEDLGDIVVAIPSPDEQKSISDHLESAGARHRSVVEAYLRSVELDRERIDRVIADQIEGPTSRAPVRRLRSLARLTVDTNDYGPQQLVALEHIEALTGRVAALEERPRPDAGFLAARSGDVLFGKLRPYLRKAIHLLSPVYASTELLCLRPVPDVDPEWLSFVLRSPPVVYVAVSSSDGTKMPRTSWDDLAQARVPVPRLADQRRVAAHLRAAMSRHVSLADAVAQQVQLLNERQATLVNAAVTGEFTIRGHAA